ncbi:hypothetical protein FHS29_002058 [Saccharothrix tamanrassetensis]|uniref:Uncharacterized protein n=1 Tax=Saccharothrix tamanrassetensis TaxID=1051531 RepID=A0A841CH84_9PSEU|nr:hypothetical protein [Saccharothrix tamanrassetensis]MBB5955477.1 hypothetical protein [Saccharothrix tamanrassetensis]
MGHAFQQLSVIENNGRQAAYQLVERCDEVTGDLEAWAKDRLTAGRFQQGLYVAERGRTRDDGRDDELDVDVWLAWDGFGTSQVVFS